MLEVVATRPSISQSFIDVQVVTMSNVRDTRRIKKMFEKEAEIRCAYVIGQHFMLYEDGKGKKVATGLRHFLSCRLCFTSKDPFYPVGRRLSLAPTSLLDTLKKKLLKRLYVLADRSELTKQSAIRDDKDLTMLGERLVHAWIDETKKTTPIEVMMGMGKGFYPVVKVCR